LKHFRADTGSGRGMGAGLWNEQVVLTERVVGMNLAAVKGFVSMVVAGIESGDKGLWVFACLGSEKNGLDFGTQ